MKNIRTQTEKHTATIHMLPGLRPLMQARRYEVAYTGVAGKVVGQTGPKLKNLSLVRMCTK